MDNLEPVLLVEKKPTSFFRIPQTVTGKAVLIIAAVLVLAAVLIFGVLFSGYLGTRAIGYKGPRASVKQGDKISLLLPNQVGLINRKVEVCRKDLFNVVCTRLAFKASQNAKTAEVQIPLKYKTGSADLRMTGVLNNGKSVVLGVRGVLVRPGVSPDSGNGGSGGSSGGGSSDNNSGGGSDSGTSDSTPTPPAPYAPYGI